MSESDGELICSYRGTHEKVERLIRCRDCRFFNQGIFDDDPEDCCDRTETRVKPSGFCAWAELVVE